MPGLDHEVHELVRQGSDAVYGCSNGKFAASYYAPNRVYLPNDQWFDTLEPIPHRMSTECRYDKSLMDSKCRECHKRGSGEAYDQIIRTQGT